MTTAYERIEYLNNHALRGVLVQCRKGIVRVRDGADTWFCWRREWEAMVDRVRSGELRLGVGTDDESRSRAYSTVCQAVKGPVLTILGTNRGTQAELNELMRVAEAEWSAHRGAYGLVEWSRP